MAIRILFSGLFIAFFGAMVPAQENDDEISLFPPTVEEVEVALPAFIGHGKQDDALPSILDSEECRDNPDFFGCQPESQIPTCERYPGFAGCRGDDDSELLENEITGSSGDGSYCDEFPDAYTCQDENSEWMCEIVPDTSVCGLADGIGTSDEDEILDGLEYVIVEEDSEKNEFEFDYDSFGDDFGDSEITDIGGDDTEPEGCSAEEAAQLDFQRQSLQRFLAEKNSQRDSNIVRKGEISAERRRLIGYLQELGYENVPSDGEEFGSDVYDPSIANDLWRNMYVQAFRLGNLELELQTELGAISGVIAQAQTVLDQVNARHAACRRNMTLGD